jgi:hypothetical protein
MRKKTAWLLIPLLLLACLLLTQTQPLILRALHAVDGSFGLRPVSHACLGLPLTGSAFGWLPPGDLRFQAGLFSFRYWLEASSPSDRPYCLGQDVWYGE